MQSVSRVPLSVGASTVAKVFGTLVSMVLIGFAAAFVVVGLGLGTAVGNAGLDFPSNYPTDRSLADAQSIFSTAASALGLCGLPFIVFGLYLLLSLWRGGAWLDGTVLSRRGALLTRSADLATAVVTMGGYNYSQTHHHGSFQTRTVTRVPALVATPVGGGRPLKLPLRGQGLDLLPPAQLTALARALASNRGPAAEQARAIGAHLHALAVDPLAY